MGKWVKVQIERKGPANHKESSEHYKESWKMKYPEDSLGMFDKYFKDLSKLDYSRASIQIEEIKRCKEGSYYIADGECIIYVDIENDTHF